MLPKTGAFSGPKMVKEPSTVSPGAMESSTLDVEKSRLLAVYKNLPASSLSITSLTTHPQKTFLYTK
jgi:hypothetical protein